MIYAVGTVAYLAAGLCLLLAHAYLLGWDDAGDIAAAWLLVWPFVLGVIGIGLIAEGVDRLGRRVSDRGQARRLQRTEDAARVRAAERELDAELGRSA